MFLELFILVLLVGIVMFFIRGTKPAVPLDPIVIHQPGKYHATLAPQLVRAETFIAQIARQFSLMPAPQGDTPSLYFEVNEPQVSGDACYLLAVSWRGGMLYFQAIIPQPPLRETESKLKRLREFCEAVLALHPIKTLVDASEAERLRATVESVANQFRIVVHGLDDNGQGGI